MTDQIVDPIEPVVTDTTPEQPAISPPAELKSGVNDLNAALAFIESGVAHLGDAAKGELVALAQKYL